ncbi:hypothetical protein [Pseudoalteromonas sp. OOF1S-7]|uniref:DUF7716 domain-containing protein n=1 Tax=Pseudoalteromonas sp. OOF1S-7 TaxID=2917757 RepID=UPI001EF4B514|nr:hypothetical protein [Pseudoalteromonas sp. OOF1S-7]MCG7537561.1 hypothetical protein [Pseudoalteromonas sp. OOF1S-7]
MMRVEYSFFEVLDLLDKLPWDHHLYLKSESLSGLQVSVLVLNDDDELERDENDEPSYASSKGYRYFLSVADLQDIKENLAIQKPSWSCSDLVIAIDYYHKNDAYFAFDS